MLGQQPMIEVDMKLFRAILLDHHNRKAMGVSVVNSATIPFLLACAGAGVAIWAGYMGVGLTVLLASALFLALNILGND